MLGESAGRSAGNTPRASARRRMTPDERGHYTHLYDDPDAWPSEPLYGWRRYVQDGVVAICAAALCLFFIVFERLSLGVASFVAVTLLTVSYAGLAIMAFERRRSS